MKRVGLYLGSLFLGLVLVGCAGSASPSGSANPFVGNFVGSSYSSDGTIESLNVTVNSSGVVSGTAVSVAGTSVVSGSISSTGAASITLTPTGTTGSTSTGTYAFNTGGRLVGHLSTTTGISTTVTVNKSGSALEYAGSFGGTFSASNGATGTVVLVIGANGALNGSATPTGRPAIGISGTASDQGVWNITLTNPDTTVVVETGFAAFNATGQLVAVASDNSGNSTTLNITGT